MNRHGLFVRGGHPTDEMRARIKAGVERHWKTRNARSEKIMEANERRERLDNWVANELAKARAATALLNLRDELKARRGAK